MRYRFGDHVLDDDTLELRRGDDTVALEPQAFAVLRYLIEQRDRVVPKAELLDEIWGDQFVSESALTTRIKQVRQAVGDSGSRQAVIKTSHGSGYRFVAELDGETTRVGVAIPPPTEIGAPGRSDETAVVEQRLLDRRLVTIVGAGGIGKSRLLHHIAGRAADRHRDGVITVELAPVRDGDAVVPAILEAVGGGTGSADVLDDLIRRLRPREILLAIDNAEHLAPFVQSVCREIHTACPGVRTLVTSRERLGIVEESVVTLGPLPASAAIELFVERAADAGVELDPADPQVVQLCERTDGVPLAIELLAARSRLLSVSDLVEDMRRHLAAAGVVDSGRHTSVEAALLWSFEHLDPEQRRLLTELTVFAGSFDLRAVRAVVAEGVDPTDDLLELCERSLVLATPGPGGSRFRLLQPVRLFAAVDGPELDAALARHARHHLAVAVDAGHHFDRVDMDAGLARFAASWPDIRVAFSTFAAARDIDALTSLIDAVANLTEARLLVEVHDWALAAYDMAVAERGAASPSLAANTGRFLSHRGEIDTLQRVMASVDRSEIAGSHHVAMGFVVLDWFTGNGDRVGAIIDGSLDAEAGTGAYWEISMSLLRLAFAAVLGGQPAGVAERLAVIGNRPGTSNEVAAETATAFRSAWDGDHSASIAAFDRAIATAATGGLSGLRQLLSGARTVVLTGADELEDLPALIADSLERGAAAGAWSLVMADLGMAVRTLLDHDRFALGARLLAARRAAGYRIATTTLDGSVNDRLSAALGDELEGHFAQGRLLGLEQATSEAIDALRSID